MADKGTIKGKDLITDEGLQRPLELKENLEQVLSTTKELVKIALQYNKLSKQVKVSKTEKEYLQHKKLGIQIDKESVSAQKELNQAELALQKTRTEFERTRKAKLEADRKQNILTKQSTKLTIKERVEIQAKNKAQRLQARIQLGLVDAYEKLNRKRNEAQRTLQNLLSAEKQNDRAIRKARRNFERLDKRVKAVDKATNSYVKNIGNYKSGFSALNGVVRNLITSLGVVGGFSLAVDVVKNAYRQAKQLDVLNKSLKAVVQTEEEFGKSKAFLSKIADDYGLKLDSLSKNYVRFTAAAKGTNLEGQKSIDIFDKVNKSSAILGLSVDENNGVLKAMEQIMSKGTVQAEELRGQLGDRLPGATNIMARALGVSTAKLDEMLKKGEVAADEALPKFADELLKTFGADKVDRIDNLVSAENRFSNAWIELIDNIEEGNGAIGKTVLGFIKLGTTIVNILNPSKELNEEQEAWRQGLTVLWNVLKYGTGLFLVYKAVIISVGLAKQLATAYTIAYRIAVVAMNRGLVSAVKNLKFLRVALVNTGIGAVLVAVTALVVALRHWNKGLTEVQRKQKLNNQLKKESANATARERAELDTLVKIAKNDNLNKEQRAEAIKKINEINPEYLNGITLENIKTEEATTKINEYIKALDRKAYAKAVENKKAELFQKLLEEENTSIEDSVKWYDYLINGILSLGNAQSFANKTVQSGIDNKNENVNAIKKEIDAINELQKKLIESESGSGGGNKPKDDRQKAIIRTSIDLQKFRKEQEIKIADEIAKNELESLEDREEALIERVQKEIELEDLILANKITNLDKEKAKREANGKADAQFLQYIIDRKTLAQEQYNVRVGELVDKLNTDADKLRKFDESNFQQVQRRKLNALAVSQNEELKELNNALLAKEINQEQHEKKVFDIKSKYAKDALKVQMDAIRELINTTELTADQKAKFEKQYTDLALQYSNIRVQESEKESNQQIQNAEQVKEEKRKRLEVILDLTSQATGILGDIINSGFENRIQNMDSEIDKNQEYYDKQIELAEGDQVQQDLFREESERKREELEKKKRKEQARQAKFNKALAIAEIGMSTAQAIMSIWAQVPKFDFGISAGILTAATTALGLAQVGAVLAQPIPAYATGTDFHDGGYALVGEVQPEVIQEPGKDPYIITGPSILDLARGTQVTPSIEEYNEIFQNQYLSSLGLETQKIQSIQNSRYTNKPDTKAIEKAISKGFKDQRVHFHTTNNNKVDIGDLLWKNNNITD